MRYKTKKYIRKTIQYLLLFFLIVFLYIIGAHQKHLPAVAEYYTGETVRSLTQNFYNEYIRDKSLTKKVDAEKIRGRTFWKIMDILVREPGYIYASEILDNLDKVLKTLPEKQINVFLELTSNPFILNWIEKPKGLFADVYQYEFKRKLQSLNYITSYYLLNSNNKIIISSNSKSNKKIQSKNWSSLIELVKEKDYYTDQEKIIIKIKKDNTTIAYLIAKWNIWKFPNLPMVNNLGKGVKGIIVDPNDKVISKIPSSFKPYININKKYIGSLGGRSYPLRIISTSKNSATIILSIPAAGIGYYIFKILLYILFIIIAILLFFILRKLFQNIHFSTLKNRNAWVEESLQEAIQLNDDTLESVKKSKQIVEKIKEQEKEKLDAIAGHLFQIHKKIENVPLQLKEEIITKKTDDTTNVIKLDNKKTSNEENKNELIDTESSHKSKIEDTIENSDNKIENNFDEEIIEANVELDEKSKQDVQIEEIEGLYNDKDITEEKILTAKRNIVELPSKQKINILDKNKKSENQKQVQSNINESWLIPDEENKKTNSTTNLNIQKKSTIYIEEFSEWEETLTSPSSLSKSSQNIREENNKKIDIVNPDIENEANEIKSTSAEKEKIIKDEMTEKNSMVNNKQNQEESQKNNKENIEEMKLEKDMFSLSNDILDDF